MGPPMSPFRVIFKLRNSLVNWLCLNYTKLDDYSMFLPRRNRAANPLLNAGLECEQASFRACVAAVASVSACFMCCLQSCGCLLSLENKKALAKEVFGNFQGARVRVLTGKAKDPKCDERLRAPPLTTCSFTLLFLSHLSCISV